MGYMFAPLRRYLDFGGRSRRMEYWLFVVLSLVVYFLMATILGAMAGAAASRGLQPAAGYYILLAICVLLWIFVFAIPQIACAVRRMHDTDRSGWWILVPIAGLIFTFLPGTPGPNRFGADPKQLPHV